MPEPEFSDSYEDQSSYFFEKYSKDLLVEVRSVSGKSTPIPVRCFSVFLCSTSGGEPGPVPGAR